MNPRGAFSGVRVHHRVQHRVHLRVFLLVPLFLAPLVATGQEGLTRVDSALNASIEQGSIAGAVVLTIRDGKVVYERAVGWADKDSGRRMENGTIFRIASQTKLLTAAAVMMLVEEGKLKLDDPVGEYLPAWRQTKVIVPTDTGRAIVPAEDEITIKQLLTHTSGISYGAGDFASPLYEAAGLGPAAGYGWYLADKDETSCQTTERLAALPFERPPGEAFVYGYSSDVLGCLVETVSGMSLDEFFATKITGPLKMKDTHFFLPPAKAPRLAAVYTPGDSGRVKRAPDGARGQGHYVDGPRKHFSGGAGLLSTAKDYARFLRMLLGEGDLEGERILSKSSAGEMTSDRIGDRYNTEGLGFGYAVEVVRSAGAKGPFPEGTWLWGGAYGSNAYVVPSKRLVIVFLTQILPGRIGLRDEIPAMIYRALYPAEE